MARCITAINPPPALGTLLNSSSTLLYYNSIPSLSSVTFVPASGYTGTVTFAYTGISTSGMSFTGTVQVTVGGTSANSITYTTAVNTPKTFSAADFNSISTAVTGASLSGVYFSQYDTTYGALYYGYQSAANPGTLLNSSSTLLYYNSIPSLSSVTFVPASGYTGTVTFPYTGVSTSGMSFTGTVQVTVGGTSANSITYTTAVNTPKTFSAADFNSVCTTATGTGLYAICFTQFYSSSGNI